MTWLADIIKTHEELESPLSFWRWSAYASISAVVKDSVWLNKAKFYDLFPNIYVMLHADSGLKKGPPISMAYRMVAKVNNTKIIRGRSSIQAILKELGTAVSQPGGKISNVSSAFICSSELTSSIVSDPAAMTILTDLYDRHYNIGEWKQLLKMESFNLKNPTITMLSGTNEAHTDDFFERKDIQGGFVGRTFIIYEKQRNRRNSLMFDLVNPPDDVKASEYLGELANLKGEIMMDHDAKVYFDKWYHEFADLIDKSEVKDSTGTLNRFDDSVLKVAMLISLGKSPELNLKLDSVQEAIEECARLIGSVRRATMGKGQSSYAMQKKLLLMELVDRPDNTISQKLLVSKYWVHANANEWAEIVNTLQQGGHLVIESIGNSIVYRMPEKALEQWTKYFKGQ